MDLFGPPATALDLTPVESWGGVLVKRDDLFSYAGVTGGKVRTCAYLARDAERGLVTAGSRASPQCNIVAHIARHMGLPCRLHTPCGELSPELRAAQDAGALVIQHKAGYNSVIVARARDDAKALGWTHIPFGMECQAAVDLTAYQVANLPWGEFQTLVVPVGSGMTLAGVLWGMLALGERAKARVLGVQVGADPTRRLDKFAPGDWRDLCQVAKVYGNDYHRPAQQVRLSGLELDAIYEAKCLPYLHRGGPHLLWVVGIRQTQVHHPQK